MKNNEFQLTRRLGLGAGASPYQLILMIERDFYMDWEKGGRSQVQCGDRLITGDLVAKAFGIWGYSRATIRWILTMEDDLWEDFKNTRGDIK